MTALFDQRLPVFYGFLHSSAVRMKPALALDFIEPFRSSIAERLALRLINLEQINPSHFEQRNNGIYLTRNGCRVVTREWMRFLNIRRSGGGSTFRQSIANAALHLNLFLKNTAAEC